MKRTLLASCILLSGCYAYPNQAYYPQGTQFRQVLVYHYQVPPPNPYYQAPVESRWEQPAYQPPLASYNQCAERNAERYRYQQPPEDCGVYIR